MASPSPSDARTQVADGVRVAKWLDDTLFTRPSIAYRLQSSRDQPVTVRVVETIPEGIEPDELGFHPAFGSEHWEVDEETMTFERTLAPDRSLITVSGIQTSGPGRIAALQDQQATVTVLPPVDADQRHGPETAEPRQAAAEPTGTAPSTTQQAGEPTDHFVRGETATADQQATGPPTADGPAPVVRAARQSDLSEPAERALRELESTADERSESVEARLRHLQSEVADLQAYTAALEEFLDEQGSAEQILERHREQVAAIQADLEDVRRAVDANEEEIRLLATEVDDLERRFEGLVVDAERFDDDLAALTADLTALESRLPGGDVAAELAALRAEIQHLRQWKEEVRDTFS